MVERAFLKIVFPKPVNHPSNRMGMVRFGEPQVYVVDADGEHLYQIDYVQDAALFVGVDKFMEATITANVQYEFPDE